MINCFDNIVTLREYCEPTAPFSGVYLNDIGLGKKQIEDIITGDYPNVRAFVEATIATAAKEVAAESYAKFAGTVQVRSALESGKVGLPATTPTVVATTGNIVGVKLSLNNTSNYIFLELKAISLYVQHSGVIDVDIYDTDTNNLLDTVQITAVSGEIVQVNANLKYLSYRKPLNLFIGYDSTAINSYSTTVRSGMCCGNYWRTTDYTKFTGYDYTDQKQLQTTSGVAVDYSISCDEYGWMCAFSQLLSMPIAYKVAAEIYRRGWMVSPSIRSNNSTNVNSDLMKANHDWYISKYNETMGAALRSMHLPQSSVCFMCKSPTTNKIMLP